MSVTRIQPTVGPIVAQVGGAPRADANRPLFELPKAAEARKTEAAAATRAGAPVAGLETLMALQGVDRRDPREQRRRAFQRGAGALDLLDEVKLAVLSGDGGEAALLKLRALTAQAKETSGDDRLDGVLEEIDLRAQVELAKRTRAG